MQRLTPLSPLLAKALFGLALLAVVCSPHLRVMAGAAQASVTDDGHRNGPPDPVDPRAAVKLRIADRYGQLPLSFEANRGQTDSRVKFLSRGSGYTLFLSSTEAVLALSKPEGKVSISHRPTAKTEQPESTSGTVLRMKVIGGNSASRITGLRELPGKSHYFIGNDPAKWRTNVPSYAQVRYENVYPGVDLIYYGNQRQLEYDFVVAPGADPNAIKLAFEGADKLETDAQGDLVLKIADSEVRLRKPLVYQEVNGQRREVAAGYVLAPAIGTAGFQVAAYDRSKPLVIDPVLSYSTYLGGSGTDGGQGIALDNAGNAYVTGFTRSADFPTTSGAFQTSCIPHPVPGACKSIDVFVTKLDPTGSALVYSTYLGGSNSQGINPSQDQGFGIAVDSTGHAYVTGFTRTTDFPTTAEAFQTALGGAGGSAFVTKLDPTGSALLYSTYLGGSGGSGDEGVGQGIAVDSTGHAYITGFTVSTDFPTTAGAFQTAFGGGRDAFVTKLDPTGSALVYSTYLGGSSIERGQGIAVDSAGNAYVTGDTNSTDFPTTAGAFQTALSGAGGSAAFVTKLDPTGSALVYSTYLGGSGTDGGQGIALDNAGNAYVTGFSSRFPGFPTTPGAFDETFGGVEDAFVTKLNSTGSALVYSTYLGGSGGDRGEGIAVDSAGHAYVTGFTRTTDFPTTAGAFQTASASASSRDAFVTKLNPAGSALVYSTYLGGSGGDQGVGIAVDIAGNAYVTGLTGSLNFPTTPGAFAETPNGGFDAFVAKIPTATIEGLVSQVATLDLNAGEQNSLTSKLQAAERSLARGNSTPAINQLNAFINQVRALEQSGRLDAATAEGLITQTQAIISQL